MLKTANKISFLVESQLPDFINEEYELFSKFVQKYYEQLELQGQPLDIITNLETYRDIDFYEKNILKQSTILSGSLGESDTTITVADATAFPKNGGYLKINDEICFYAQRTDTQFLEVSRGVSGNTTLGNLYNESAFVTTQADPHANGSTVQNISNLFLYALVKSFESQYLADFPEAYLKEGVDKRTLIKNIASFYKAKGTDKSVKFLFKCLIKDDPEPEISYPRDHTLKGSESEWIQVYALKAKITSGDPTDLIGKTIVQNIEGDYASAVVDNVKFSGKYDGEDLYEVILSEQSVNGNFSIAARTTLTENISASTTVGDRINVFSTLGWGKVGEFKIDDETFTFEHKNVNQFVIKTRSGSGFHSSGSSVTYGANVSGNGVNLLVFGVLYNLSNQSNYPYSNPGDTVEISEPGFLTDDIKIFDAQNNLRWVTTHSTPGSSVNGSVTSEISDLRSNVSAIFEDGEAYYIASSGFPSHDIIKAGVSIPSDIQDQRLLKIVRKNPIATTEIYETKYRDIGVALNGIPFLSHKDEDSVLSGPIQSIDVSNRGTGYQKEPFVLVNGVSDQARSVLAGQVVESVIVDVPGNYNSTPTVEIVSGRYADVTAIVTNGEVTSITINNPGEYYSSPPEVLITDSAGKGRFADYTATIDSAGQITGFVKVNGGSLYTQENISVQIIAVGSGATATAKIREWRKDRYYKNLANLDSENGYFFKNFVNSRGHGYAYYASPSTLRANDNGSTHSPILGFAYDGNPIYGPFGYADAVDPQSSVVRMTTSYFRNTSRNFGPPVVTYPIGTFIDDYTYIDGSGSLDQNNGRYCVTPEFPNGTYAYFMTVDASNSPEFPYILGLNYYSLPVDSNYNSPISQEDIPLRSKRLRTSDIENNGDLAIAKINDTRRGSVSSASILRSVPNFSVGSKLKIDNSQTEGFDASAEVDSVKGRQVVSIESQDTKALFIELISTAYLFDGDTITQSNTGATGQIVGNVFSGTRLALRNVSGTFSSTDKLSSNTTVVSLILSQNSSYTKGAVLSLSDGINLPVATGEVLETTIDQNTVKVKVTSGTFVASDDLIIRSSDLINTTGSKIAAVLSLSSGLDIFTVTDNVALLSTADAHGVAVNEKIDIDINPDDSTTTTTYYVRTRIYQEVFFKSPVVSRVLSDTGVGRIAILNGGNDYTPNTYQGIALSGGSGTGAEATIVVSSSGTVNSITITNKGSGYKKFDLLTVGNSALNKTNNDTPTLQISVDHVGFSIQNPVLTVDSSIGITTNDFLQINDEIVKVINKTDNNLTVERAQKETVATDHFDGATVTIYDPGYNLNTGYQIGSTVNDPSILSYDPSTQKAVFVYEYNRNLSQINKVSLSTVFFDQSADQRLVEVDSVTDPDIYFELSSDNTTFVRNQVLDIKKCYKYTFDVSHSSMSGVNFDFSPSINLNVLTTEKTSTANTVSLKIGFGPSIASNQYTTKENIPFTKYFYFDRNGNINSESSFVNVVSDPLQGIKTALYVTSDKILYSTGSPAPHDGSGLMTYTSKSIFSIGEINSVKVVNIGRDYRKLPLVTGINPTESYAAVAEAVIESGRVVSVNLTNQGKNYSKPVITCEGNAKLTPISDNGKITGIVIDDSGSNYTTAPEISILESDLDCYLNSEDIGVPTSVRIINNGGSYHNDGTLSSTFRSNYILLVSNFDADSFRVGETIVQRFGSVEVARARVTSWRNGSNILIVDRVKGIFRTGNTIIGLARNKTAKLESLDYTSFSADIKSYYDNQGYYKSDLGKVSDSNQRITDSYYYQDYSYLVKSRTSVDTWRSLIKTTSHPAGFQLFGEVLIESSSKVEMSPNTSTKTTSIVQLWNPDVNKVTVISTKKKITQSIALVKDTVIEKGVGSVSIDTFNTSEVKAKEVFLNASFDGAFTDRGNLEGTTTFNLVDRNGNTVSPYNEQALTITLDGIIQEPGIAYTVSGDKIVFAQPPLGSSIKDGQVAPGVKFYGRWFQFKTDSLNQKYLKKIKNIFQRSGTWIDAANQLGRNRAFIQSETLGYIKSKYTTFAWGTLDTKCYRDIGLIIDALEHDLRFGGNEKTIKAAESYFRAGTLDYIDGEIEATIDAFAFAVRLCKLAMRNWDYTDRQVSWNPGTNIVETSNTDNITIGMRISAGRAFPEGTRVAEILDSRNIRVTSNSLNVTNASTNTLSSNTVINQDTSSGSNVVEISPGVFLQITPVNTFSIAPATGTFPSDNAQMTFIWSGLNTGTFFDASTLIAANKVNIQREASHRIYNKYPNFTYPRVPKNAFRFKDSRRLIYENLQSITDQVIAELESQFGEEYATDSCARDLKIIIASVAEDIGRGGNSATIASTNMYFDAHDALEGERSESVFAFEYARELCIEAINNRGTIKDSNIILVPECNDVNSSITTLFDILISAITNNQKPSVSVNTGIKEWVEAEDFCFRDTGLFVDAVVHCLRYGGNKEVIDFANAYFYKGDLNHVKSELRETIYAYNQARDLMIDAMLNQISGSTIIAPYTDPLVRVDTSTPLCAEVKSAITTFAQIVEDTLEGGPDRIEVIPANENSIGNWTTLRTYSNINILPDPQLVNGVLKECEEVASSLDSLYENIRTTLVTGKGTAVVSNPDYIDGENTVFDLYYEDGTPVNTDKNENLFIALSGVLQHETAYSIDRTVIPNKVVFATPPIWGQNENTKTVQEPLAVEKFFAHSVGNYLRCEIDKSGILDGSAGPFLVIDTETKKVKSIDDSRFALVFIDGTLQREKDSYMINGSTITFTRKIFPDNNVEIVVLYGRDVEQSITLFDFQRNTYYNELTLTCDAGSANNFLAWKSWYNNSYDKFRVAYQKIGGVKKFIGNLKTYTSTSQSLIITLAGTNPDMDSSNIFFAGSSDFSDEYELTGTTNNIVIKRNDINEYRMQRNSADWLYGTERADESFYERKRLLANLNAGDVIKIDGEKSFRTINKLPQYVNPKNYNPGVDVSNSFFGSVTTTNYDEDTDGVGLSVSCEISNGSVTSVSWNRKDLQLQYDTGIIQPTTAYGYNSPPVLHFVPRNQQGGGARAEVVVSRGQIIDIVITNPGSGYTEAPKVITARQYDIIKKGGRKIDTFHSLVIGSQIQQSSPVAIDVSNSNFRIKSLEYLVTFDASASKGEYTLSLFMQQRLNFSAKLSSKQEIVRFGKTSEGVASSPVSQPSSAFTLMYQFGSVIDGQPTLNTNIESVKAYQVGFSRNSSLEDLTIFNNLDHWENSIFIDTGNLVASSGTPVSKVTVESLRPYQITSDGENATTPFMLGYPTINYYMQRLDVSDVPAEGDAGYLATGAVVYVNGDTSRFPASGTILLGREQISYTSKLTDRFLDCTRGVNGTPIEEHLIGEYLRNVL